MMKTLLKNKNRTVAVLLAVCLLAAVVAPLTYVVHLMELPKAVPVDAIPTTVGSIFAKPNGAKQFTSIASNIPVYAIKQANGYYSNYMKLRDIAYYLDFDVVWSADDPNVMRLYTNRHYLDNWTAPGPATQAKMATLSTMDIYVDDVKVKTGVQPMMIDFNNYFKVRDIAKIMDFWCEFKADGNRTFIHLDNNYRYVDEAQVAAGVTKSNYAKRIDYQPLVWYSGEIGKVSESPVTYSLRDAWGNYDYTKLYLGYTNEGMNAVAQLMLDRNLIAKDSSGVKQLGDGNKLNAYYRYPMIEFTRDYDAIAKGKSGVLRYNDVANTDIGKGKMYYDSNFGANLAIHPVGEEYFTDDPSGRNGVKMGYGIMSVEYDANNDFAKGREVTLQSNTVQRILERMNTLSCDEEKVQFLAACVDAKMQYCLEGHFGEIKEIVSKNGYWVPGTEFTTFSSSRSSGNSNYIDFYDIGKIWDDSRIYAGVCNDYSYVFENLCAAAGYYYVSVSRPNHIWDAVWLPDEGKWVGFDASGYVSVKAILRNIDGTWKFTNTSGGGGDIPTEIYNILDFFVMMEQIKPGGWLSPDPTQNP